MRLIAIFLFALGLIAPTGARAHASLVASDPVDGAVLTAAPALLILRFNEPVSPLSFKLIDAGGVAHDGLVVGSKGETIEITPPGDLPRGTQTLSYRIVSADGHPVGGVVAFSIGMPGGGGFAAVANDRSRAFAIWAFRLLQLAGLTAGVGAVYFLAFVAPAAKAARLAAYVGLMLAAGGVAVCLSVGLQGLDLLDRPLSALAELATWRAGVGGLFGLAVAQALANPDWTANKLLQGIAAKSLTPEEANAVIAIKSAEENIQGMRKAAGGGLSNEQVNRLEAQIPGASTPNYEYAKNQLGYLNTTLGRLAEGVPETVGGETFHGEKPQGPKTAKLKKTAQSHGKPEVIVVSPEDMK